MNEDQAIQNIDILIDLWKPYTHGGHWENDWDIFEILFQEATGRFVFTEHNTNSYNDVHLCRKAQTTASNRQSTKAEWFIDVGPILKQDILQGYMKTQWVQCWYRELLDNGFKHQLEFVRGVCSPEPSSTSWHTP